MKSHYCEAEGTVVEYEGECNWCGEKEMTQDNIKAGVWVIPKPFLYNAYDEDDLQMVADAAAKAEREACAQLFENEGANMMTKAECAAAIRARSEK